MYPRINENCVECKLCEKVCPIIRRDLAKESTIEPIIIYALHLKDEDILLRSSSGGAFTAFATTIINSGGLVYGAVYDDNMAVKHISADTIESIDKFRGSKYVQSDLSGIYPEIKKNLSAGRKVLFTGTPCQIHGLKSFLIKEYDNLFTVDIVCHAVPSPMIFKEYVKLIEKRAGKKLKHISMRDKTRHGWGHYFSFKFIFENGKELIDPAMIWGWNYIYFSQFINRPSCHSCRYTNFNRPSDLTIADYWDDENKRPELHNQKGKSLCLVNTEKGRELFELSKRLVEYAPITKDEALQPCLQHPTPMIPNRNEFWDYYKKHGFEKTYKHFFEERYSFKHQIYLRLKGLIEEIKLI
jgi:coenzyme F420-reducing hydrogenase beta subunit